ncbi:MAG: hypothetical protein ACRYFK_07525 [Janthinobacterium lividum]
MATKELTPDQKRIAELEEIIKRTADESAAKDEVIAKQDEQLAAANAQGAGALSVVTHAGKNYQVLAGQFSLDDNVIKHHELKAKPELVAKLVEDKSPLLQLLDEPKK